MKAMIQLNLDATNNSEMLLGGSSEKWRKGQWGPAHWTLPPGSDVGSAQWGPAAPSTVTTWRPARGCDWSKARPWSAPELGSGPCLAGSPVHPQPHRASSDISKPPSQTPALSYLGSKAGPRGDVRTKEHCLFLKNVL